MTEEYNTEIEKLPDSGRTSTRKEKTQCSPKRQQSPLDWDFDSCFPSESPVNYPGRVRASSWDDSDDNLSPIPDNSGSKTCRIYTSDDKKPKLSVVSEINELKAQFFRAREKEEETEGHPLLDNDEQETNCDRRLSPARVRRRSRSSGSSSPVMEMENQASPRQNSDTEFQDSSPPKMFQYDPTFYLNHFFTELRSRRISLIDPVSVIESIGKEMSAYDGESYSEITALDGRDLNAYFCKASRKLSQILEVEENKKDLTRSSEENLLEKCLETPTENDSSPFATSRSKRNSDERRNKYKSFSSEYLRNVQKPQNSSQGSLSERTPKFFDGKLDDGFIGLSAKIGKTQLASPKCSGDRGTNKPSQLLCDNTPDVDDTKFLQNLEDEKHILEALKIDFMKNVDNVTPRKSTDRSEQSQRSGSGNSRNCNVESPKFALNIGRDSARVDDADDSLRKENAEEYSFRKTISENCSPQKTERVPPIILESPSVESVISTQRSLKEQEILTNRSKSQNSSRRRARRQNTSPEIEDGSVAETKRSPVESPGEKLYKTSRKSSAKSITSETEHVATAPNSKSGRIFRSPRTPRTTESRYISTPRSNRIPVDISERPKSRRESSRSGDTARTESPDIKRRSQRQSDRSLSSRSRTVLSPRGLKMTPRVNSGGSRMSKDSLDSRNELGSARAHFWRESGRTCDTISNHSGSASSLREGNIPSQQHSYRSETYNSEEAEDTGKPQLSRSRNSSKTSVVSNVTEACRNISSPPASGRTHRSILPEEDEDEEENAEGHTTHRSKMSEESDRLSNKRLSVINEVSFEDLEASRVSTENEENDTQDNCSRRQNANRTSPDRTSANEPTSVGFSKPEREEWRELINKFNSGPDSFILDKFPGFPSQKEISWNSSGNKMAACEFHDKPEENLFSRNRVRKTITFEKSMAENLNNLVYQNPLTDKTRQEEFARPAQAPQSIYYVNVSKGGSFGIGEFGDVTCWNAGDSDTKDSEKPKDHGDGIPMRTLEVRLPEKNDTEVTTPIGDDFRESTPNTLFPETADDTDPRHYIHCRLKASKSDNCLNKKVTECQESSLNGCKYKSEASDLPSFHTSRKNHVKATSKSSVTQNSSSDSLGSGKDWENLEFAYERTPRLSRSLSNLDVRLQENLYQREPSETLSLSNSDLFKRTSDTSKTQKESTTLNLFLARRAKEDKMAAKPKNWLKLKQTEPKHKRRWRKKSKEPFHDHLSSRKGRPSVPTLKLRNPNCFQNFYKRFISVFCLTANSSAATSK